ncbi:3-oxoadipate enol-lactonase [Micromonospora sp. NPDC049679]|uniref:3-oxoadipate enol-lactonase n=1 Tax=Micromonospora sp. NPDC049679 TaxID=3155920 RepID=UPI0033EF55C3
MTTPVALHHVIDGPADAPVLLLANSLGSTIAMWEPQLPRLTAGFRVVRFDTRGHGRSPVPAGPYALADLGADVLALLDRLDVERAHFAGLSLGGMVGMWLAAHAPQRVDRLVLCCTSARLGPPEAWAERARTVRAQGTAAVADAVVQRWFTPAYAARHSPRIAAMRAMVAATPAEGYASCCTAIQEMDLVPALPRITAPTLVIAGADDPATPPVHASTIAGHLAGARVTVVPDAAHLANVEQPDRVTDLILEHLNGEEKP